MLSPDSPFAPLDPAGILLERPAAVAFLDRFPVSRGHALVVPTRTVRHLADLTAAEEASLWAAVRDVRHLLAARFRPDAFNIGVNDGAAAGQTVPHAHVHLIPRYAGDTPDARGGIRWVMPHKARYWPADSGTSPAPEARPATPPGPPCRAEKL